MEKITGGRTSRTTKKMNVEVNTTEIKQEANAILGTKEKKLYYLIIGTGETKTIINVGLKTYENVTTIIKKK